MADYYSQGVYLLAAHADHVLLNQSGAVLIEGLGVYQTYQAGTGEAQHHPHVFKVGTYKSLRRALHLDEMSPRARRRTSAGWISCGNPMWPTWRSSGRSSRMPCARTRITSNCCARPAAMRPATPLDNGLVDQLATRDEMTQAVIKEVGEADDHGWKGVGLKEYLAAIPEQYPRAARMR